MKIKVCGMREPGNIRSVESLGIDMMGFIFYERSPRFAGFEAPGYLPASCRRVGVFVDADADTVAAMVDAYGLDMVQLHGHESVGFCRDVKSVRPGIELIKAFSLSSADRLEECASYEGVADLFLFDTPTVAYGGSGKAFDWGLLGSYRGHVPFLLSGGIGPDSAPALRSFSHPMWVGIDLNSRFETGPGIKDPYMIKKLIDEL